jgi:glycosyltransferase involved in cell wall biosynthesis
VITVEPKYRVVQVVDSLLAGGAERVAVDTANALSVIGHYSYLCATRTSGALQQSLSGNVVFHCINRTSTLDWRGIFRFRSFIAKNTIQLVHAHGNSTAMFCVVALVGLNVRIVHHDHNPILDLRRVWRERILLSHVDAWICVSEPILKWAKENIKYKKAIFIQNPVDTTRFKPRATSNETEPKILVVVANYKEHKDYLNLLQAIHLHRSILSLYQINCYGGHTQSPYFKMLMLEKERLQLNNVSLLSSSDNIPKILSVAEVGILSSSSEGLPISLLEYMAAGLPVVVTDVGECGTIVRAANNGYVVPPKNPEFLSEAIIKIINHPDKMKEMSKRSVKYVHENFSLLKFSEKISNIYSDLILIK